MYIDLLVRIKNAQQAGKETAKVPFTTMDMAVSELLVRHGFLKAAEKKGRLPHRIIELTLAYENGAPKVRGVKLVSKPSRRLYAGYRELRRVRQGFGIAVLSTPRGLMESMEAKKRKVGGQVLFEIW